MQRFGKVRGVQLLAAVQVGDRARHAQNTVVGAGAVAKALKCGTQNFFRAGRHAAVTAQGRTGQLRIAAHTGQVLAARLLHLARGSDAGADGGAALSPGLGGQGFILHRHGLDMQVDAVQQRARDAAPVLLDRAGRTGTLPRGVAQIAALAGVHGGGQHKAAGVARAAVYPADRNNAILQRLAQHFEGITGKLRQFVQKQHAVMGQAHLAGARGRPTARDGRGADAVVRAAERPLFQKAPARRQQPGHGVDGAGLERFLVGQRRQNAGQALGQHAFARARRPHKQQIMPARSGNLQRTAGFGLPAHIGHIGAEPGPGFVIAAGRGRGDGFLAAKVAHHVAGAARRVDGQRSLGGFGGVFGGDKQLGYAQLGRSQRHGQHTRHRAQRAVQAQLAQKGLLRGGHRRNALRGQQPHQQGQVVHGAGLAHVRRGQVDGDAAGRPGIMQVFDRAAHPLAALFDSRVRQTHERELRQTAGEVGFDLHRIPRQPRHPQARDLSKHGSPPF